MDEALRLSLQRWQAVWEFEQREMAESSFELRWQQLNALFDLAASLGILPQRDEELETIGFQCWARLKGAN
jgi:hypothetical protein